MRIVINFCIRVFVVFIIVFAIGKSNLLQASPVVAAPDFCQRESDWASVLRMAEASENRMGFANPSGSLGIGLCWWHSLFQRSAFYLAAFKPELPKPTHFAAIRLINMLVRQDRVVEIPGYRDLKSFSTEWQQEIESALSKWQIIDGFIKQEWIRNVSEQPWTSPSDLLQRVKDLEKEIELYHRIPWVMLKLPGFEAHAWLVLSVKRLGNGFALRVIDSNYPELTLDAWYHIGDMSIQTSYGNLAPTVGFSGFFPPVKKAIEDYCKPREVLVSRL
jgi:hypothetical protein